MKKIYNIKTEQLELSYISGGINRYNFWKTSNCIPTQKVTATNPIPTGVPYLRCSKKRNYSGKQFAYQGNTAPEKTKKCTPTHKAGLYRVSSCPGH